MKLVELKKWGGSFIFKKTAEYSNLQYYNTLKMELQTDLIINVFTSLYPPSELAPKTIEYILIQLDKYNICKLEYNGICLGTVTQYEGEFEGQTTFNILFKPIVPEIYLPEPAK